MLALLVFIMATLRLFLAKKTLLDAKVHLAITFQKSGQMYIKQNKFFSSTQPGFFLLSATVRLETGSVTLKHAHETPCKTTKNNVLKISNIQKNQEVG